MLASSRQDSAKGETPHFVPLLGWSLSIMFSALLTGFIGVSWEQVLISVCPTSLLWVSRRLWLVAALFGSVNLGEWSPVIAYFIQGIRQFIFWGLFKVMSAKLTWDLVVYSQEGKVTLVEGIYSRKDNSNLEPSFWMVVIRSKDEGWSKGHALGRTQKAHPRNNLYNRGTEIVTLLS